MQPYGKLVLTLPGGIEQVYDLAKDTVTLGRDAANDITLADGKVSRNHVQVQNAADGCFLIDLNSSNGTFLNGQRVQRTSLTGGDLIQVGNSVLRFEASRLEEEPDILEIDSVSAFEATLAQNTVNMTIADTSRARIVVRLPERTWEVSLRDKPISIGRTAENDIVIEHAKVSRKHAVIEMEGDDVVIHDLGSTNGTFLGSQPVQVHILKTGDTLRIGPATLVFKSAFSLPDLTLVDTPLPVVDMPKGHLPVIFVPGLMGSQLWAGSECIWPNTRLLISNPEVLALPDKHKLEPRGIVNEVVIVPNLIKQEQYNRLGDYFVQELKYTRGVDLLEFAYDWRQDVRESAKKLARTVEEWDAKPPYVLMAHSLGSLVSRYYIEKLGGKSKIDRAIFLGGPHYGVPKAVANAIMKVDLLPFGILGDRLRNVLSTFPTIYQILPIFNAVFDQLGNPVRVLDDESWLPEDKRPLLRMARQFRHELGRRVSVPSVSIFGYGLKTTSRIDVVRSGSGEWEKITLTNDESGDTAIPDSSTVLEGSDLHPVSQYHGSLFVDNDVKMRLKLELTGRRRRA